MQKMRVVSLISILKKTFSFCAALLIATSAHAYSASDCDAADFASWQSCIYEHFSAQDVDVDFTAVFDTELIDRVVELDRKQPESKLSYKQYLERIGINKKIADAKQYLTQNRSEIAAISSKYGVEPEAVVALITLESDLGRRMGNFDINSSLATLAYDGRRKNFFEAELFKSLQIKHRLGADFEMRGSWAGAMGQCQFMPSSYLNFAVDTDNKGYADIWHNKRDVYASVANYLSKSGWKLGENKLKLLAKAPQCKGENCQKGNKRLISLDYDANMQRFYEVGSNYQVLMKWNRSSYFCTTVLRIMNAIKTK